MRVALAVVLMTLLGGHAQARPDVPLRADVEAMVRQQLARPLPCEGRRCADRSPLKPAEIDRLLREPRVRAALGNLFDGWDGVADELRVERRDGELVIHTLIRERRCLAQIALGPEIGPVDPTCDEVVRADGDRRLIVGEDAWRAKPKPKQVADVAPKPETEPAAPEPTGPVDNTVLRRKTQHDDELGPIGEARAQHELLKDALRRPHYKDPMLPADAVEAGAAIQPFQEPPLAPEARVETNLRNPFDPARMRVDLPVPDMLTLPNDPQGQPLIPEGRDECGEEWRLGTQTPRAPTLDCYRRVAWNSRLDRDDAYKALAMIASIIKLPILDTLVGLKQQEAASHQAHRLAWALVWLAWVKDHPDRTTEALAQLTPEERRFVRRRIADWWVEAKLAELRPTITRLFERHFLGLYPEAMDHDGLPRRTFVTDTWLWANNWLAVLDGRPNDAITAAYQRLSPGERRVIGAFVRDRDLCKRWARAAEVIASL